MGTAVEPNLAEVTRDEMIRVQMEKIEKLEKAEIRARAEAIVEEDLARKEEAKRRAEEEAENAKAHEVAAKERAKAVKTFASSVSKWMIDNDCTNPSSIPASVTDSLREQAGL